MKHALLVALTLVACKGKDSGKASTEKPTEPAAAQPAPPPATAPQPTPAPAPPVARPPTPIAGFAKPAVVELPDGFAITKDAGLDGEGDAILATNGGLTLQFVATEGKAEVKMDEVAKGMEAGSKTTWVKKDADADGFVLVFEQGGKTNVNVYRSAVHGFCGSDDVPKPRVDEVVAICKSLRPS